MLQFYLQISLLKFSPSLLTSRPDVLKPTKTWHNPLCHHHLFMAVMDTQLKVKVIFDFICLHSLSQFSEDRRNDLIKYDLSYCVNDRSFTACFWDFIVLLSLLKLLQIPLFFKYLVNYLREHNRSGYFIKIVRVRLSRLLIFNQPLVNFQFIFCTEYFGNHLWLSSGYMFRFHYNSYLWRFIL